MIRSVAGVGCFIAGALATWRGAAWLVGFVDLQADESPAATALAQLALGAFVVAGGFCLAGLVLMSRRGVGVKRR